MDDRLKQRLIGAVVLVLAGVIFVPMLLDRSGESPQAPARIMEPQHDAGTRVVPLDRSATTGVAAVPEPTEPAKPVAVEKPPAPPAVTAGFAVQLGSFSKSENAMGLRDKLVARGYAVFVKSSGSATKVYVGPQPDRAAAEKMLKKLRAETKLKGIVVDFAG